MQGPPLEAGDLLPLTDGAAKPQANDSVPKAWLLVYFSSDFPEGTIPKRFLAALTVWRACAGAATEGW